MKSDAFIFWFGQFNGVFKDVAYMDGFVFCSTLSHLLIFDMSDPSSPQLVSVYEMASMIYGLEARDNLVYFVADHDGILGILDVSNPANPQLVSSLPLGCFPYGIELHGNHAYVVSFYTDVIAIDITDPFNPELKGTYDFSGQASGDLAIDGNIGCVGTNVAITYIFDISDPDNPTYAGEINVDHVWDIAVKGDYAYLAIYDMQSDKTLVIMDISHPSTPGVAGVLSLGRVNTMDVSGDYAYLTLSGCYEFVVVDITDVYNPVEYASTQLIYYHQEDLVVDNNIAYMTSFYAGLEVVRLW